MNPDLKVGTYWGDMGVDFWDAATWKHETEKNEVQLFFPSTYTLIRRKINHICVIDLMHF